MKSKIIKLVNNTKAIFKFDDKPKAGSDALVTSGVLYNTLPVYYTFNLQFDVSTNPATISIVDLDIDSVIDAALEGKTIILRDGQGGLYYLTTVDKDTPTTTILFFMSLMNGNLIQIKVKRQSGVGSTEFIRFSIEN